MLANPNFLSVLLFFMGCALQLGDVHSKQLGYAFWGATVLMVLYAGFEWLKWPTHFRRTLDSFRIMRFGGRISLHDAARVAYAEARASGSIWADAAERLGVDKSPDGVLDYIAMVIAADTQIWGKRLPSDRIEAIDPARARSSTISGGARELRLQGKADDVFVDLVVETKDLRRVVDEVRVGLNKNKPA